MGQTRIPKIRTDGWTIDRQLRFLETLAQTRSITKAARDVGMSRESAYRLRDRAELFAALWDRALAPVVHEVHNLPLTIGRIMRLLGNRYRRKTNGFWQKSSKGQAPS